MKSLKTGLGKRHHRHPLSKKAPLTEPDACFRKLRTSALSALETSFFAKGMEAAYIDAMMESGIVFPPCSEGIAPFPPLPLPLGQKLTR